ncbi:polyketide synthase dehydratase domain-containing protein [Achromobacter insuavis]
MTTRTAASRSSAASKAATPLDHPRQRSHPTGGQCDKPAWRHRIDLAHARPDFLEAEHNQLTCAVGLAYGPAFRAIQHGWHESEDSVLAALQPHASLTDLDATHLHPTLLDCSFQLIIQLLKEDPAMGQGIAFVPAKIGRLNLHAGQGQPKYARARLRRRAPHSLTADFDLFDADGKLVATVREARFAAYGCTRRRANILTLSTAY